MLLILIHTLQLKKVYPGLFDAINAAEGTEAVDVLMDFTSYERPQEPKIIMVGGRISVQHILEKI